MRLVMVIAIIMFSILTGLAMLVYGLKNIPPQGTAAQEERESKFDFMIDCLEAGYEHDNCKAWWEYKHGREPKDDKDNPL